MQEQHHRREQKLLPLWHIYISYRSPVNVFNRMLSRFDHTPRHIGNKSQQEGYELMGLTPGQF